ncbi:DUF1269 domain-containing protein [Jiangella endophytica]|uniref:DUF1269 domain-containing protein n=1 Tax=Jiangella endophytica TaxID=1623398 RepID=UPI000E3548D1|nr:DUF1269 domain-containing protein [Jiangella endophytica]
MSELIVIGYDDHDTAKNAYAEVQRLQSDFIVDLTGLAVVTVDDDGKQHVDTPGRIVSASAASGALWGALFGLLFLIPGMGLLLGGAMGALLGKLNKSGIDEAFRNRVHAMLQPGRAAVVIMAAKITEDKFAAALRPYGGEILQTSLSKEHEEELASELRAG